MKYLLITIIILLIIALFCWHQGYWSCDMWQQSYANMTNIPTKWNLRCSGLN